MNTRRIGILCLVLALAGNAPVTQAQQLVKGMKCADFFLYPPIEHRHVGTASGQVTVQVVRDRCRPKQPDGEFIVQMLGPGPGNGNHTLRNRYRGYTESITLPFTPGDRVRVLFGRPFDARTSGTFDYTYTLH